MNEFTYEVVEWVLGDKTVINIKRTSANSDEVSMIPTDPANSDYQAYLKSLETTN